MTRTQAREQAFALLFEKSFHPEAEMEDVIELGLQNASVTEDPFTLQLARTAGDKLPEIDARLELLAKNWKKNRFSKVSLSVLRLALCELLFFSDIPVSVSINEAVELSKKYAGTEDASFVNGILGAAARALEETGK